MPEYSGQIESRQDQFGRSKKYRSSQNLFLIQTAPLPADATPDPQLHPPPSGLTMGPNIDREQP